MRGLRLLSLVSVVASALVSGSGAMAEDYDPAVLEGCLATLASGPERAGCIGIGAARCMETEAGGSNVGIGYCYTAEWEDWDARLNAVYQRLLVEQAERDADTLAYNPNLPSAVEALRAMQRAWIPFRDAACEWEWTQWGGGTGGGPASSACMMELTARQTLFLEQRLAR